MRQTDSSSQRDCSVLFSPFLAQGQRDTTTPSLALMTRRFDLFSFNYMTYLAQSLFLMETNGQLKLWLVVITQTSQLQLSRRWGVNELSSWKILALIG